MSDQAGRRLGTVGDEQLLGIGLNRTQIRKLVSRGLLHPRYLRAYTVGHTRVVPHAQLMAALLSCGSTAFLSHRTAGAVRGLRQLDLRRVDVTVPGRRLAPRDGLIIHQTREPARGEVTTYNNLRVSSVPRLLIELAPSGTVAELEGLITEAVRRRVLDFSEMEAVLARHARRPGVARLRQALRDYRPGPDRKSHLERAFDALIAGPEIPEPQRNVVIAGYECDCYWPEHRLVVELDGRNYHTAVRDMERDKRKDAKLALLGLTVLRYTELRFELEPVEIRAEVVALTRPGRDAT